LTSWLSRARARFKRVDTKHAAELAFWQERLVAEGGALGGPHYRGIFTDGFGLDASFFAGKRMLDIGCGPRGSLEWADMAAVRVGVDPLADEYLRMGADRHTMRYEAANAERLPFPDASFDVVSSLNSLDHVDDVEATVAEILRVLAPGGTVLLITHVGHEPSETEPNAFGWEILDEFVPPLRVVGRWDFEKPHQMVYASILAGIPYDHADATRRSGILRARLEASA
jgi:SAM-dependent methyltransferase